MESLWESYGHPMEILKQSILDQELIVQQVISRKGLNKILTLIVSSLRILKIKFLENGENWIQS